MNKFLMVFVLIASLFTATVQASNDVRLVYDNGNFAITVDRYSDRGYYNRNNYYGDRYVPPQYRPYDPYGRYVPPQYRPYRYYEYPRYNERYYHYHRRFDNRREYRHDRRYRNRWDR